MSYGHNYHGTELIIWRLGSGVDMPTRHHDGLTTYTWRDSITQLDIAESMLISMLPFITEVIEDGR